MSEQEIERLKGEVEQAKRRLAMAQHIPLKDRELEECEKWFSHEFTEGHLQTLGEWTEVHSKWVQRYQQMVSWNMRLAQEIRYLRSMLDDQRKSGTVALEPRP